MSQRSYDQGFSEVLPLRFDQAGKRCGKGYVAANKKCRSGNAGAKLKVPDDEYDRMGDEYAEATDDLKGNLGFNSFNPEKINRYNRAWKSLEEESKRRGANPALERLKYLNRRKSIAQRALIG